MGLPKVRVAPEMLNGRISNELSLLKNRAVESLMRPTGVGHIGGLPGGHGTEPLATPWHLFRSKPVLNHQSASKHDPVSPVGGPTENTGPERLPTEAPMTPRSSPDGLA